MLSILLLSSCLLPSPGLDTGEPDDSAPAVDADGDGFAVGEDCDDNDDQIHPNATEVCDDVDNNCDGQVDEGLGQTWYMDADGDGFGDDATTQEACAQPGGYVNVAGDCDDSLEAVNPNAEEVCNGQDDDCDGDVDFNIWALEFDAVTDRVIIENTQALNLGSEGTLEFWMRLDGVDETDEVGAIFSKMKQLASVYLEDKTFTVFTTEEGGLQFGGILQDEIQGRVTLNTTRAIPSNTWLHVAISWDDSGYGVYISGSEILGGEAALNPLDNEGLLYLGASNRTDVSQNNGDVPSFLGALSDLRISDLRRYTGTFTPEPDLEADADTQVLYALREGAGTRVNDVAGNGEPGNIQGASWAEVECRPVP